MVVMTNVASFVTVATVGEIPPGGVKRVVVGGRAIAVFNVDGAFYALDDRCSHEEASLSEGEIDEDVVECPKHGARFNIRTGKNLTLPAVYPVKTYPVQVEGDEIKVCAET
jgi:3-phenylpropionate/trans-cinnamate dioxygenase ferredoxin subunit